MITKSLKIAKHEDGFELYIVQGAEKYTVPVITMRDTTGYVNRLAFEILEAESKSGRLAFARRGDKYFVCMVPETSEIKGFSVIKNGSRHGTFCCKNATKIL